MKRIHIEDTHDKSDCVTTGYTLEVGRQGDGDYMVIITYNINSIGFLIFDF